MKVLIAVKGAEGAAYFQQAAALAPLAEASLIILAHVIDTGPRGDLEFGRDRFLGRRPLPPQRGEELARAEEERAQAGLAFAREALLHAGIPEAVIRVVMPRGKPNEALRELAEAEQIDLVVVAARGGKPGPHSLGKTARFLVDHAPHAALLIRP